VAVKRTDGKFEWRPVRLGAHDESGKYVEVVRGLKPGEHVALIWQMSEDQREEFIPSVNPAPTKNAPTNK
jgi:tRNA (Thr-GGU) A37 N-methylase